MSVVRLCKSIARLSGQAARARLASGLGVRAVAASLGRARPAAVAAANTLAARAALLGGVRAASTSAAAAKLHALSPSDTFARRHLGPNGDDVQKMLSLIGEPSVDALIDKTVPKQIRSKKELAIGAARTEAAVLAEFKAMMSKNEIYRSHLGTGYYDTIVPPVILRNLMENPAWYTPYTPYQAEIAQGRLEMLLNFQTMVADLTGLAISNCSLLDEGTAAAEAMKMCHDMAHSRTAFLVADNVHPQTLAVVKTRAESFGISVRVSAPSKFDLSKGDVFGVLLQYPATDGSIESYAKLTADAQAAGAKVVVATDLLALTLLAPPGEWGADIAVGSTQRFGVPMGFGGPHAAFLATSDAHKRKLPGRVIGVSKDSRGKTALRMAMQTREQHIRRDKASSNICTAQALLANMSAAYAIYHGPNGLKEIATRVHGLTRTAAAGLSAVGAHLSPQQFFDTLRVQVQGNAAAYVAAAHKRRIGIRAIDANTLTLSFDETTTFDHVDDVVAVFAHVNGVKPKENARALAAKTATDFPAALTRKTPYLTHSVFNSYHSETEMLRYLYKLQSKDLSLATAMIPLGSCTMKLNATTEMIPVTWPEVNALHPFVPPEQAKGYAEMLADLSRDLCNITGFAAVSLQPNAGSQGEYAGLRVISAYHVSRGDAHRNICLIPTSAHGTNPASAVMAGLKVVAVACDEKGNIDVTDLKAKAKLHAKNLHSLMVTYPSTHGVFEESIKDICVAIHENGGQVYMDGANMNAQVGLCSPGEIGADVCHLNLHKTFCIPHGGGGPGMGPIGVAKQLAPFLPGHPLVATGGAQAMGPVSAAPFSSASILPISYLYIKMMGSAGLKAATETAILNANYMAKRLAPHYKILYTGANGTCAHEFIIDLRPLKATTGVVEEDVAKRLLDFNFHAPTMSFPVPGTLMVEPTESESLAELDRFCDAMIHIRAEIRDIETGKSDRKLNVLKGAPHTADVVIADKWDRPYSREAAAYPLPYLRSNKFWPSVGRLDNVYGDRNLVCSCPPMESYL